MDTIELVNKAKAKDMKAFEELMLRYEKIVYNLSYRMMQNYDDAKDITQDVFIKVYQNLDKFNGESSFKTWIYRITTNTCLDELRKRKRKVTESLDENLDGEKGEISKQIPDNSPSPEESFLNTEKARIVKEALYSLQDDYKTIIILKDIKGLQYTEISEIMQISLGTVKSKLSRARKELRNILLKNKEQNYLF